MLVVQGSRLWSLPMDGQMIIPFFIDLVSGDLCVTGQTLAELKRAVHLVCRNDANADLRTFCGFNPTAVNFKFKLTPDWGETTCWRCRAAAIEDDEDEVTPIPFIYTSARARHGVQAGQMVVANADGTVSAAQIAIDADEAEMEGGD